MVTRFTEWATSGVVMFFAALVGLVVLFCLLTSCDTHQDGCLDGSCMPPEFMCGAERSACIMAHDDSVCCFYGGMGDGCTCSVCVSYRGDEVAAEKAYVELVGGDDEL